MICFALQMAMLMLLLMRRMPLLPYFSIRYHYAFAMSRLYIRLCHADAAVFDAMPLIVAAIR